MSNSTVSTVYFNKYLFFIGDVISGYYYNGTTWGLTGYTYPVGFTPMSGCVFKNRLYFVDKGTALVGYSGIDYISGTITSVDLSSITTSKTKLLGIRSVSMSEGISQDNVLCFCFDNGEVLAYSGSYPNSSDWRIVGRFVIPKPIDYHSFVDANGDSFVITECGLISLRDLFAKGGDKALNEGISGAITNRWDQIMSALFPNGVVDSSGQWVKGHYDQGRDRIVIVFSDYVTKAGVKSTGSFFRLIYSFKTQSWWEHYGALNAASVSSSAMFKNDLYYGTTVNGGVLKAEGASGYLDVVPDSDNPGVTIPAAYTYKLITAPLPLSRNGINKVEGAELLMKSDLYTETEVKLISDLGAATTTAQKTKGNGTNVSKCMVNSGVESTYVQLQIGGTTVTGKTTGQEIYGMNIWYDKGGLR